MSDPFEPLSIIADKIASDGTTSLTTSELEYFALTWFVIEIQNGGFNQYFSNDAGRYAHFALDGLRKIGASKSAALLDRAISIFPNMIIPEDQAARGALLDSLPEAVQWDFLSKLSSQFYIDREPIADLFSAYVATHRAEYPLLYKNEK